MIQFFSSSLQIIVFIFSCKICSLTGEDLEEDENIRKKLQRLDREVGEHFERFDYTLALETAEEELEVMDEHRDLFVLKVSQHTYCKADPNLSSTWRCWGRCRGWPPGPAQRQKSRKLPGEQNFVRKNFPDNKKGRK